MPKYSIVVPFHNEEENVTALYDRLKAVMETVGDSFELVLVDDGSSDRSYKLLEEIAAVDSRVLVVKLRRNFGQTSALAAGFDHAQGEYILRLEVVPDPDVDERPVAAHNDTLATPLKVPPGVVHPAVSTVGDVDEYMITEINALVK